MTKRQVFTTVAVGGGLAVVVLWPLIFREFSGLDTRVDSAQWQPWRPPPDQASQPPGPLASADALQVFAGKVVLLGTPEGRSGTKSDDGSVALVADDGTVYPLVEDDASRMFHLYDQLRNRPVRLSGRLVPGTKNLRVEFVRTITDGAVCDVDFWCEICQISHLHPSSCVCCGDDTVLRERPAQ